MLRTVLNVLWVIFGGGFVIFLEYLLAGLVLCATIVGIPFGLQCFKVAKLAVPIYGGEVTRPGVSSPVAVGDRSHTA